MNGHSHHHPHSAVGSLRLAFFLNLAFAILEMVGGFLTNSITILAGALHDLGDSATLAVSWYLERVSLKVKDQKYSYGYKRFSLLGAVFSATVLLTGSVLIFYEAIQRLIAPQPSDASGMIIFAVLGIAVNGAAVLRIRGEKNMNARMIAWHLLDDVLGWSAVLIMSIVLYFADIRFLDPVFSLLITAFVVFNVFKNLRKTVSLFLQAVPEKVKINDLESRIRNMQMVKDVHHTHVWSLDGEQNVLTTHIVLESGAKREEIRRIKCLIHEMIPQYDLVHTTIEFEYLDEDCSMNNRHSGHLERKSDNG
jgi:cobalt-zinc-cadmium efflux system protein